MKLPGPVQLKRRGAVRGLTSRGARRRVRDGGLTLASARSIAALTDQRRAKLQMLFLLSAIRPASARQRVCRSSHMYKTVSAFLHDEPLAALDVLCGAIMADSSYFFDMKPLFVSVKRILTAPNAASRVPRAMRRLMAAVTTQRRFFRAFEHCVEHDAPPCQVHTPCAPLPPCVGRR